MASGDTGISLQLMPMLLGFLTYKGAVIARGALDLFADLSGGGAAASQEAAAAAAAVGGAGERTTWGLATVCACELFSHLHMSHSIAGVLNLFSASRCPPQKT